ncbi:MAG TPA: TRAP transporter substrate-binding protein [Candidatus Methylomirabilis sp.]
MHTLILIIIAALSLSLAPGTASAQAKVDPLTIKFAHAGSSTHPYSVGINLLTPILEKNSGGAVKLQVFCCAQLGSERELAEGVRLGTINMTSVAAEGALPAWVPELQAFGLPFIIRDRDHIYKVLDGPIGKELERKLSAQGFVVLGWWELGFRNMTSKDKPIRTPDDLKGLKMRVQEAKVWLGMMRALGAIPTPIPFGELYSALQQGVVDGQENPIVTITSMKFYEVQKQVGLTEHTYTALPVLASKKWWDTLKPAQRDVIAASVKESVPLQRKAVSGQVDEGIAFLKTQGVTINTVDKAKFMEATKDVPKLTADQVPLEFVQRIRDTK